MLLLVMCCVAVIAKESVSPSVIGKHVMCLVTDVK